MPVKCHQKDALVQSCGLSQRSPRLCIPICSDDYNHTIHAVIKSLSRAALKADLLEAKSLTTCITSAQKLSLQGIIVTSKMLFCNTSLLKLKGIK
jgi:hypothetical protein